MLLLQISQPPTFIEIVCAHCGPKDGVHSVALLTGKQVPGKGGVQHSWTGGALAQDELQDTREKREVI